MIEPVQAQQIMLAAMAGALVILLGALYALFYAWAKIRRSTHLLIVSGITYLMMAAAVLLLAYLLNLSGFWFVVVCVMLAGYLLGPPAIWRLCVDTHDADAEPLSQSEQHRRGST